MNNQELFYTLQGLTKDGAYYVAGFFPVTSAALPGDAFVADYDTFNRDFGKYLTKTTATLDELSAADFSPDLELLDAVISSLVVEPDEGLLRGETDVPAEERIVLPAVPLRLHRIPKAGQPVYG